MSEKSLTIILTALNEELNIEKCLHDVNDFLGKNFSRYQIIFVDDGSLDNTFSLAKNFALNNANSEILILKNEHNLGVGASLKKAIPLVTSEWLCWVPTDLEFPIAELVKPIAEIKQNEVAQIILTYPINSKLVRSPFRFYLSKYFTSILNRTFKQKVKYYNGINFYKKNVVNTDSLYSNRFFFHAELLLKSLRTHEFSEVGILLQKREFGQSNAIKLHVWFDVIKCYLKNVWDLKIISNENINY